MSQKLRNILKFLDHIPEKYKTGPWSPAVHVYLYTVFGILLLTAQTAYSYYNTIEQYSADDFLQTFRLVAGVYCALLSLGLLIVAGPWPFTSYTMTSWNLMTVRLLTAYCAAAGDENMKFIAGMVKFPALVGCSITVVIWWSVLVPLIHYLLRNSKENTKFFREWNTSFFLLNIHLLNLPVVGIEFLLSNAPLTLFDLWMGFLVANVYVLFYLNVLDPLGLHFYIILTPRTWVTVLTYTSILGLYYLVYSSWNRISGLL